MKTIKQWWVNTLFKMAGRLPCRFISNERGGPYLERYYLGKLLGVTFYLHRFVSGDGDRGPHDHPWYWARSLVLAGWYNEEKVTGFARCGTVLDLVTERRTVEWFNSLGSYEFHRIVEARPETWTLFFHSERVQYFVKDDDWGSMALKGWGFLKNVRCAQTAETGGVVTAYVPVVEHPKQWWRNALKGRDASRTPVGVVND